MCLFSKLYTIMYINDKAVIYLEVLQALMKCDPWGKVLLFSFGEILIP